MALVYCIGISAAAREQALADENAGLKRQLAEKSVELEIEKNRSLLCQEHEVKYAFIHQHRQAFSIQRICAVLRVARSGYYVCRQRYGALPASDYRPARGLGLPSRQRALRFVA